MPKDAFIGEDGIVYEKGWDGQWKPKVDSFGSPVRVSTGGGGAEFIGSILGFLIVAFFWLLIHALKLVWAIMVAIHRELYAKFGQVAILFELTGYGILGVFLLVFVSLAYVANTSRNYTYAAPNYVFTPVPTVIRLPTYSLSYSNGTPNYVSPPAPTMVRLPTAMQRGSSLGIPKTSTPSSNNSTSQGIVNVSPLILRDGPSTNNRALDRLPQGTVIEILARNNAGDWFKVTVPGKSEQGWVSARYINTDVPVNSLPVIDNPLPIAPTQVPGLDNTATPLPPAGVTINYYAEQELLARGSCTVLHWGIENVQAIYLNGEGVDGWQERKVCPDTTTTYTLRIVLNSGNSIERGIVVKVQ